MNGSARTVEKPAGLYWGTGSESASHPVPLEGVKVHGEILGHASRITTTQRFRHAEQVPIEAVYVFPLPEAAAVCGLAIRVGDRRIEGEVERRDEAFDRYDDAMGTARCCSTRSGPTSSPCRWATYCPGRRRSSR